MFYIFHGTEEFRRAEEVARFRAEILKDGMGDLNVALLDGRKVEVGELIDTCLAVPFLTERRLVVVEDLLQRLERGSGPDAAARDRLLAFLPQLPDTTRLVFVETRTLAARSPFLKIAKPPGGIAKEFAPLSDREVETWIRQRAQHKGAPIEGSAVALLAVYAAGDLRRIDQELDKLAAHAGYGRSSTREDVQTLVVPHLDEQVFPLVDALGAREGRKAIRLLQQALQQRANALYLLTMIGRQVRLLVAVRDLLEARKTQEEIRQTLKLAPFVARKLSEQVRQFTGEELLAVQQRVLAADRAIKTGRGQADAELELLVIETCQRPRRAQATRHG